MQLPQYVISVLNTLNKCGYEAFVVGGSVRDFLMGREPVDYDITTSATPDQIKDSFKNKNIIKTGIRHGTVTLIEDGHAIEITTYRTESNYSDNRHPDRVSFTDDINQDLSRRDFTVNAICFNPQYGYLDPFGGRNDIKGKIIKTVGDPFLRFNEDALRILRAIRFASVLEFDVDFETEKAVRAIAVNLKSISMERIFSETKKLLLGNACADVLNDFYSVVCACVLPENSKIKSHPDFSALLYCEKDIYTRLAAFFICVSDSPKNAQSLATASLKFLKSDRKTAKCTELLVGAFYNNSLKTDSDIKWLINKTGFELAFRLVELWRIFNICNDCEASAANKKIDYILKNGQCCDIGGLAISGNDLIDIKIPPIAIGGILNELLRAVINEKVENSKDELIKFVKNRK